MYGQYPSYNYPQGPGLPPILPGLTSLPGSVPGTGPNSAAGTPMAGGGTGFSFGTANAHALMQSLQAISSTSGANTYVAPRGPLSNSLTDITSSIGHLGISSPGVVSPLRPGQPTMYTRGAGNTSLQSLNSSAHSLPGMVLPPRGPSGIQSNSSSANNTPLNSMMNPLSQGAPGSASVSVHGSPQKPLQQQQQQSIFHAPPGLSGPGNPHSASQTSHLSANPSPERRVQPPMNPQAQHPQQAPPPPQTQPASFSYRDVAAYETHFGQQAPPYRQDVRVYGQATATAPRVPPQVQVNTAAVQQQRVVKAPPQVQGVPVSVQVPVVTMPRKEEPPNEQLGLLSGPKEYKGVMLNRKELPMPKKHALFFVIKSYGEDDVHKSIKYQYWCSTKRGNGVLQQAWQEAKAAAERDGQSDPTDPVNGCPIYLFFSVNRSRCFCGMAQMVSPYDRDRSFGTWVQQGKWQGSFRVKWIFVKDIPNKELQDIILENNEGKPVTFSRDTQDIPFKQGLEMLHRFVHYRPRTYILQDFQYYDQREDDLKRSRDAESRSEHGSAHAAPGAAGSSAGARGVGADDAFQGGGTAGAGGAGGFQYNYRTNGYSSRPPGSGGYGGAGRGRGRGRPRGRGRGRGRGRRDRGGDWRSGGRQAPVVTGGSSLSYADNRFSQQTAQRSYERAYVNGGGGDKVGGTGPQTRAAENPRWPTKDF